MLSWWHSVGIYPENELTRNLSGNIRPQSSQPAELLWTDPGMQSGIIVRKLISTSKERKKAQAENEWSSILPKILQSEETATTIMFVIISYCLFVVCNLID